VTREEQLRKAAVIAGRARKHIHRAGTLLTDAGVPDAAHQATTLESQCYRLEVAATTAYAEERAARAVAELQATDPDIYPISEKVS
jgi:precorrin-4 methylase